MAVFQDLLRRLGFVKLGRYGLTLTADDRIVSTRPAVLDNGAGQRVVGWRDDDLAMAELAPWNPALDSAHSLARRAQFSATPPPRLPRVAPARVAAVQPVVQPVIPQPSSPGQAAAPAAPPHGMPVAVAPEAVVDEDDWEWSIALARARVAADEATAPLLPLQLMPAPAPPAPPPLFAQSTPASPLTARGKTPPRVIDPRDSAVRPEPSAPPPVLSAPVMPGPPLYTQPPPLGSSTPPRATVIPVPRLPSIRDGERAGRFEPVVRTTIGPAPAPPPGRLAKGTAPIGSDTEQTPAVMPDDTELTLSVGDRTMPGVAMPLAARAVALPSILKGGKGGKGGSARRG